MDQWKILGISPTDDAEELRSAYLSRLPDYNPEDDPEGFQRLRAAYEALKQALPASGSPELSPTDLVVQACREIYEDFPRRLDPLAWQEVLQQEMCQRLDVSQEIGEKLLAFLMDSYHLPRKIWRLLADFFCWEEQELILREKFPDDFLNYVGNSVRHEEMVRYIFFQPPYYSVPEEAVLRPDYDRFIDQYFAINNAVNAGDYEPARELIASTDQLGIPHPDYALLKLRAAIMGGDNDETLALADELLTDYPLDRRVLHGVAQAYLRGRGPAAAKDLFLEVLKAEPEHYHAQVGLATCYFELQEYEQTKEYCRGILLKHPYDAYVTHIFVLTNDALIPDYEARLREQPEDASLYYKLAACYCNREKYAECCELLAPLVPEAEHAARYHDLYAYALMHTDAKDAALKHFQLWEKLEPDKIRLARELPAALLRLDRPEEALEKALLYQADFPQEAVLYDIRAQVLLQRGVNPDEVLPIIAAGLAANPEYLDLYRRQAEIYYERGLHAEALDSINEALDICPWHGEALLLKIRLYYQARDYATVRSIIAQARENYQLDHARLNVYYAAATLALPAPEAEENATAVTVLRHRLREQPADRVALRALTDYYEENDYLNPAIIILNDAIAAEPEYLPWRLWRIRLWRAAGETLTILEEINRLEKQVESADLMVEKGLAWQSRQEYDRARECFEQAIAYDEYHSRAYADLAELCQETKRFGEAADYYTRQLQVMPSAYYYLCRGYVYSRMGDPEKEEADYRSALKLEPDYDRAHNNMGVLLYEKEQWAEACEHLARACELNPRLFSARQFLAKTLYKMGAVEEALQILREAAVDFAEPPERPERTRSTARKILNALFAVALLVLVVAFNRSDRVGALPSALVNLAVLTVAVFITLRRVREHHPRRREKPETEAHVGWILTECYREIAGIYRKEGRYQEALDLIPYLQHAPVKRDAATLCHIAYCAAAQGQKRRSRHYYRQALRQDPHCEEARRALKPEATST